MGENNVKEIKCSSVEDFIHKISYNGELYGLRSNKYIYRGESSDEYKLIPSALREQNHEDLVNLVKTYFPTFKYKNDNSESFQMVAEYISLHLFYMYCDYRGLHIPNTNDFRHKLIGKVNIDDILYNKSTWLPSEYIEIAGLAQHYGVYTRLLDWSRNINVALYFAVSGLMNFDESEKPENIVLWVLNTTVLNTVEKDHDGIILSIPEYAGNPNLCAQKGVFSLYSIKSYYKTDHAEFFDNNDKIVKPLDEIIKEEINSGNEEPILYKILIPTPQNYELYNYLCNEGYDASLIFPGFEGTSKTLKENLYWSNQKQKNKQ
ncbi:hypothetical protein prwr041_04190 [Prevotella herbatica]|uniref:FRG domain-containing protein n=1 Tax=Prevotella herbatica TaxID=2801997 RepID=A0ABM7NVR5_9BACT|nr:FRG domain-containing protein [Prevotella herbatica]BCS84526.1 hypothetical protein prwr041_04190 [Prevotella herbatica]